MKTSQRIAAALLAAAWSVRAEIVVGPAVPPPVAAVATGTVGAAVSGEVAPTGAVDRLVLLGGEWLRGMLVCMDPVSGMAVWRHPAVAEPIRFHVSSLAEVQLGPRGGRTSPDVGGLVRLTNGDEIRGEVRSLDGALLLLANTPAGDLRLRREMIVEIVPGGTADVLYEGPNSLEEWTCRGDRTRGWQYRDGALWPLMPMPLGLRVENMGDAVRIDFTVDWRSTPGYFSFWFFHEKPEDPQGDAYMLNLVAGQRMDLNRMRASGGAQNLGAVEMGETAMLNQSMRVSLFAHRGLGEVAVMINGKLVRQWKDPREFKGRGNAVTFMPQGARDFRLTEIRVARWSGVLPQTAPSTSRRDVDTIVLANGDQMSGALERVADGRFVVQTPFTPVEVPADRVVQAVLAPSKAARARRRSGDVRLRLVGGGIVTMELAGLDGRWITGSSENFGETRWPVAAVRRIEFNLYGERHGSSDD